MSDAAPRFACDAMLRGLARWLRAWGYDATWTYGIDDAELLDQAVQQGRVVLTADSGIFERRSVREGRPPTLRVANERPPLEQLLALIREKRLPRRASRCMRCGGELMEVRKEDVADRIPPRTRAWLDEYFECSRCRRLLWRGTHYSSVESRLDALERRL